MVPGNRPGDSITATVLGVAATWWADLDRGWQASLLGGLVLVATVAI